MNALPATNGISPQLRLRMARVLGLICVGLWGWYLGAMFRTSDWGYHRLGRELLTTFFALDLFALPLVFLPLIGVAWRTKIRALGIWACLGVFSVELFARAQEHRLLRRLGPQPTQDYTETRWWPFEHHSLGVARGQWWGCD